MIEAILRFLPPYHGGSTAAGLLVLRIIAGTGIALHGWPKIQNPFGWMGPDSPVPGVLQAMAALAEFGGGICWVLGLLTPLASVLILCTMTVAAGMVHIPRGDPFVGAPGEPSYELAALYLVIALLFLLAGPGRLALDYLLLGRRRPLPATASG